MVVGLLAGAGLPVLFAAGLRALYGQTVPVSSTDHQGAVAVDDQGSATVEAAPRPPTAAGIAVATVCFAIVAASIAWGIWWIVGHR